MKRFLEKFSSGPANKLLNIMSPDSPNNKINLELFKKNIKDINAKNILISTIGFPIYEIIRLKPNQTNFNILTKLEVIFQFFSVLICALPLISFHFLIRNKKY